MNHGRFATSLHIMVLLMRNDEKRLTSDFISGSININPAVVRKEISNLREHGLIECKEGKGGGCTLAKNARNISLKEIFNTIERLPLLGRTNDPNPNCMVGMQINQHLDLLYLKAEKAVLKKLDKITLYDFSKQFI